jgi:hypothetical protein
MRSSRIIVTALAIVALAACSSPATTSPTASAGTPTQAQMDAMMQYAAFVSFWSGAGATKVLADDVGVRGVHVTTTPPPYVCVAATPDSGMPQGSQSSWVLGEYSYFSPVSPSPAVLDVLWPKGATSCDKVTPGQLLIPPAPPVNGFSQTIPYGSLPSDLNKPALDIATVYNQIPKEFLTNKGQQVFASYQKNLPKGSLVGSSPQAQILPVLAGWLYSSNGNKDLPSTSPAVGLTTITGGTNWARPAGSAVIPAGYTATWSAKDMCVQGTTATSTQHVSSSMVTQSVESGGAVTPEDGPCPKA